MQNLSPDPNDEYFADGMTEELISAISNVSGLSVISRTSVMQYKKPSKRLGAIGEELGAGTILEGSVRKAGNKVRVSVQLIDVREDKHLWAQNYDRELQDVFAIQSDIAERVAKALEVKVLREERERFEGRTSKNSEALTLYLKGRTIYNDATEPNLEPGVRRAIEYYNRAVQQDPDFTLAYVGLADCYYALEGTYMSHTEGVARAKENLDKALALNPELGEAHASLGGWLRNELRWKEAADELRKAVELSPSYANAHSRYAHLLISMGRLDEALSEARKAEELDPLTLGFMWNVGLVLYYQRNYDQAIEQANGILRIEPTNYNPAWIVFVSYLNKRMFDKAETWFAKWRELRGDPGAFKAYIPAFCAALGRIDEAKTMMKAVEHELAVSPVAYAYYHMWLGNIDLAFEFLDRACEVRDSQLYDVKVDPNLDPLRSDPRFGVLLQKLHLS